MVAVKERLSGSWLDPKSSPGKAKKLQEQLLLRMQGEKAVFLTLTYQRREGESPRDLYIRAADDKERHVRKFMARLSKALGQKFTGRWICKMEFQQGGWIHWHLIVIGIGFIKHAKLEAVWGHGHAWIVSCTASRIRYFAKYIAKGGNQNIPGWLYGFPTCSVKVIRTSPGFWKRDGVDVRDQLKRSCPQRDVRDEVDGEPVEEARQPRKPRRPSVPIGRRLEEKLGVTVRALEKGRWRYRVFPGVDVCLFGVELAKRSACAGCCEEGWLRWHGTMETAEAAYAAALARSGGSGLERGSPGETGPAAGLHLNTTQNPPPRRSAIERRQAWERDNSDRGWVEGEGPPVVVEWWEELEVEQECREEDRIRGNAGIGDPDWIEVWTPGDTWIPHHVAVELERRGEL